MKKWAFLGISFIITILATLESNREYRLIYCMSTLITIGIAFILAELETIKSKK